MVSDSSTAVILAASTPVRDTTRLDFISGKKNELQDIIAQLEELAERSGRSLICHARFWKKFRTFFAFTTVRTTAATRTIPG